MIYKIGDFYIEWSNDHLTLRNDNFMKKFEVDNCENKNELIKYRTQYMDLEEVKKCEQLYYSSLSEIYKTERGLMMIYHWATCRFAIGYWMEDLDKDEITCYINPKMNDQILMSASRFFSIAGLHRVLLNRGAAILHASYIEWNGKAILFTAPSQTGKSTQSNLWNKNENATIINDDRVLIRNKDNVWKAYGYPSCGSSHICINRTLPIQAIVVLQQGSENKVVELSDADKIKALVSGTEVFTCNSEEIEMSIQLSKTIASEVQIIKLVCLPNDDAVDVLKTYLLKEDYNE